jgi:hypothetical protein
MPYIGNTPADKFLTLAKQSFSTSATTSYTLDSSISSTQDIALFINSVRQSPVDAYSVSGTALTLTSATAGTDEMYCVYLGKTVGTVSPASDSVTTAMLQANAVTGAKLNTDVISAQTALGATPADTDELLVSDAGVLKRVDYSYLKSVNTPYFHVNRTSSAQSLSDATYTNILYNNEVYDSGSCYNTSNGRFTPNVAGYYFIYANPVVYNANIYSNFIARFLLNGSTSIARTSSNNGGNDDLIGNQYISAIQYFNGSSDYVNVNIYLDVPSGSPEILNDDGKNYFGGYKLIGA